MPASKNPLNYPHVCFDVMRTFERRETDCLIMDGQDYRDTAELWPVERARKKAKQMQLTFNGFRQAMRLAGRQEALLLETLEFTFQETPTGGECIVRTRDTGGFTRAVRKAMLRQGIQPGLPRYAEEQAVAAVTPAIRYNGIIGVEGEPQQKPFDYGLAEKGKLTTEVVTAMSPDEKQRLEQQWLKEGVEQTKHFEETLRQLGFVEAERKPEGSK
jgi:hypothetical protein